jgi:DNA (cytosine-5)-methyltransferase 1
MRDYLEDEVDEKYYLTSDKAKELIDNLVFNGKIIGECGLKDKVSFSATVSEPLGVQQFGHIGTGKHQSNTVYGSDEPHKDPLKVVERQKINIIGHMDNTKDHTFESANRVYNSSGLCPTIPTCGGGGIQPKVLDVIPLRMVRTEEGKNIRKLYETGKIHHKFNEYREVELRTDGLINTITTVQKDNTLCEVSIINEIPEQFQRFVYVINGELYLIRIRRLTPLECWRLMGFSDEDFHKAESVVSNTQLYKQAGNSIVKQVLMKIFEQILNLY